MLYVLTQANEIYIGNMVQGKYESVSYKSGVNRATDKSLWIKVENTHEPIIEKELWSRVQELRKGKNRPFVSGEMGIFSNKLKCTYCGYHLRTKKCHGYRYFECGTKYTSKNACIGAFIPLSELQARIKKEWNRIVEEYLDESVLEETVETINMCESRIELLKKKRKEIERKSLIAQSGIKNLYTDKITGVISQDEFMTLSDSYRKDIKQFMSTLEAVQLQLEKEELEKKEVSMKETIRRYTLIEEEEIYREMIASFVDYIEVGRRSNKKDAVPLIIHWKF